MIKEEIREGDIVEIDYIEEFTGIHRKKGKALVLWKGLNNQPLITLLEGEYSPKWSCYEYISKVIGHISLEEALDQQPCEDAISRQAVIDGIKRYFHDEYYQRTSIQDCRDCLIEDVIKDIPSVTPIRPKSAWIDYNWSDSNGRCAWGMYCHSCNKRYPFGAEQLGRANFCPNCGADMRGARE